MKKLLSIIVLCFCFSANAQNDSVFGCIDSLYIEFNDAANIDDGSCETLVIYGCTSPYSQGDLYNPLANTDDGSCILIGCADGAYVEYYTQGFIPTINDDMYNTVFCSDIAVFGCTDNGWLPNAIGEINDSDLDANPAINYNPDANIDDGSCITVIVGCTDSTSFNYNEDANIDDGSCLTGIIGCMQEDAFNYNPDANIDDGSCYPFIYGCLDPTAFNYNDYDYDYLGNVLTGINGVDVNTSNGTCIPIVEGCLDPEAENYIIPIGNPFTDVNTDDESCIYFGCIDPYADNYDPNATYDDGECLIGGCMLTDFPNYNSGATYDDGSCTLDVEQVNIFDYNNTGINASIVFPVDIESNIIIPSGSIIASFYTDYLCAGSSLWNENEPNAITVWGDDTFTNEIDGFEEGQPMNFRLLTPSGDLYSLVPSFINTSPLYQSNGFYESNYLSLNYEGQYAYPMGIENDLCINPNACNFTNVLLDTLVFYNSTNCIFSCDSDLNISSPILINLRTGWNTVAYHLQHESSVVDQFEGQFGSETAVQENINIVKNNEGLFYWPDFLFDGLGMLVPGQGYQVRVKDSSSGLSNFIFDTEINSPNIDSYEEYVSSPIVINLHSGWNTIGYQYIYPSLIEDNLIQNFGTIESVINNVSIIKDNYGNLYLPEYNYSNLEYFTPGEGYQIRIKDSSQGLGNFHFLSPILGCTDSGAFNYSIDANIDDGSCLSLDDYLIDSLQTELEELNEQVTISLSSMQQALDSWNISIDLSEGWNMFGYGCPTSVNLAEGLSSYTERIIITKDNNGNVYLPEYDFNGIGDFISGFGYQIKVTEEINNFSLCDWYVNDIPEDNLVSLQEENAYLLAYIDSINTTGITQIDPNAQQYNFNYVTTGTSHSIILPYYETGNPNSINNIVFSGDITEPFPSGSLLGVFYTDYTNTLVCGGSTEWLDGSNQISAWLDDTSTPNIKDGFSENEPFIWFLLTPDGLFYQVTSIELANFNPVTNSYDPVSNSYSSGSFSIVTEIETQFVTEYEVFGCMDPLYLDYNEYANVFTDNLTNSSLIDSIPGNILVPDGIDDDCLILIE